MSGARNALRDGACQARMSIAFVPLGAVNCQKLDQHHDLAIATSSVSDRRANFGPAIAITRSKPNFTLTDRK